MESVGGVYIQQLEVKFLDLLRINLCESIHQGCFRRSRTTVGGSKMIRDHCSPIYYKLCRPSVGGKMIINRKGFCLFSGLSPPVDY